MVAFCGGFHFNMLVCENENENENENNHTERRWFLLRTKSSDEFIAHEHLEQQGFFSFFPRMVRRMRFKGKRVRRVIPLFPQYLFLNLLLGREDLSQVKSTKGILNVVRFGEQYATVPDQVVKDIQATADPQTGLTAFEERRFIKNTPVQITPGPYPFGGLQGTFLRECGADRVLVLFNILGRSTPVEMSESLVESMAPVMVRSAQAA